MGGNQQVHRVDSARIDAERQRLRAGRVAVSQRVFQFGTGEAGWPRCFDALVEGGGIERGETAAGYSRHSHTPPHVHVASRRQVVDGA